MMISLLLLALGLVLLFFGGEGLVRGSSALALRLGLTPLVVGLTVVAFGTSSPELVVSLKAALAGKGDIAIGNVVGSNIFNIGFILGLTALICPLKVQLQILKFDAPIMVLVSLVLVWVLRDATVSWTEGLLLTMALLVYVAVNVYLARQTNVSEAVKAEYENSVPKPKSNVLLDVAMIIGGLVLLVFGSRFFVDGAVKIAESFGVSQAIIGLTIIAAGTSMPELAASVVAALRKEPDIALGNIIGSNIFNILGILGLSALFRPIVGEGISSFDLWVMVGFAGLLVPLLWTGYKLKRWEGGLFLAGYIAYVVWLWPK
jgi:cation:H+ antiporter